MPAVQARVAEERGDAEEARVRVPDLDGRRVEDQRCVASSTRPTTANSDASATAIVAERARHPRRERRAADDRDEHGEREQEELEQVARRPGRVRPQVRQHANAANAATGTRDLAGAARPVSVTDDADRRARAPLRRARRTAAAAGPTARRRRASTKKRCSRAEVERQPERRRREHEQRNELGEPHEDRRRAGHHDEPDHTEGCELRGEMAAAGEQALGNRDRPRPASVGDAAPGDEEQRHAERTENSRELSHRRANTNPLRARPG